MATQAHGSNTKTSIACAFLWALLFFLIANGICYAVDSKIIFGKRKEERNVLFQAVNSAVSDFKQAPRQDVVLLGSSLMMTPIWAQDLRDFPGTGDVYHHHKALALQRLLPGDSRQIFNFALPGAMVSDQYLLLSKLLKDNHKPRVVVYGLAPRDFMDDLLTGETRTPIFQSLSDLSDLLSYHDLYLETWNEKGDFAMNNMLFFYGKRCRYQDKLKNVIAKTYNQVAPASGQTEDANQSDGALDLGQSLYGNREAVWNKSKTEYAARYRRFNRAQFAKQKLFLSHLLDTAASRGIKMVLLDMPLTADNIALMPPGFYSEYKRSLSELSQKHHATVIDTSKLTSFNDDSFLDTVHLNASGGQNLAALIAASVHGRSQLAATSQPQ